MRNQAFAALTLTLASTSCAEENTPRFDEGYLQSRPYGLSKYLTQCAFNNGWQLTLSQHPQTLFGYYGLANEADKHISPSQQRWISACLLAVTNAHGEKVAISLTGEHSSLPAAERRNFNQVEGAFYGNLFSNAREKYACFSNRHLSHKEKLNRKRLCTLNEKTEKNSFCGFTITGNCEDVCATYDTEKRHYTSCKTPDDTTYSEVITVLLEDTLVKK